MDGQPSREAATRARLVPPQPFSPRLDALGSYGDYRVLLALGGALIMLAMDPAIGAAVARIRRIGPIHGAGSTVASPLGTDVAFLADDESSSPAGMERSARRSIVVGLFPFA